jgi:hypothetical protein
MKKLSKEEYDTVTESVTPDFVEFFSARAAFIALGSFGFFNVYALRVNLSVAIMSMVKAGGSKGNFTPVCGFTEAETDNMTASSFYRDVSAIVLKNKMHLVL